VGDTSAAVIIIIALVAAVGVVIFVRKKHII
jgi:LPXTG-motif cell wall-anchored protein